MLSKLFVAGVVLVAVSVPTVAQVPKVSTTQTEKSGYDLLALAGTKLLPGPNGGASNADPNISRAENLKRERLAVARNAPALALVREAIRIGLATPAPTNPYKGLSFKPGDQSPEVLRKVGQIFRPGANAREFARQLSQESDVRFADGDYVGAMDSKLDTLDLSIQFGRGPVLKALVGTAIEGIGRLDFDKVAGKLDASQCRAAAARLASIESRRASFAEMVQRESQETQMLLLDGLPDLQKQLQTPEGQKQAEYSPDDARKIIALTPDILRADAHILFDPLIKKAALPYPKWAALPVPVTSNPLLEGSVSVVLSSRLRFIFERDHTLNFLLCAALELRAQKLESGSYPAQFCASIDPFSPDAKPLVYLKTARDYFLYSVGPDGRDDNGAEIQTIAKDEATGTISVGDKLAPDSTGDIVQTPF